MIEDEKILLARIDERVSTLIESHNEMREWMKGHNDRICQLEACQNRNEGRTAAISVVSSFLVAIGTLIVAIYTGVVR
jgi:hypothetical protein